MSEVALPSDTRPDRVSVAVVGRGLIGSAAARHLAERGVSTALIGPGEPVDYRTSAGPFASHYDEGRITRIASPSATWAELGARSIRRYEDIARRSGIDFHDARGLISAGLDAAVGVAHATTRGGNARLVDTEWVTASTGIVLPNPDDPIVWEDAPAGVINPRRLVAAQTHLAASAGGTVVDAPVERVDRFGTETGRPGFELAGTWGEIRADRLVFATGAYDPLSGGRTGALDLERRLRTIVLAELGPRPELPSLVVDQPAHPELDEIYWVPPIPYPDGRICLKIGGDSLPKQTGSPADIRAWFAAGGDPREAAALRETVRALLPTATVRSWDLKPCVVTYTPTDLPYIGWIDDGIAVALGGSGSAAKSSDELGRLAAVLAATGEWDEQDGEPNAVLHPDRFTPRTTSSVG